MTVFEKVWLEGLDVPGVRHIATGRFLPPLAGGEETPEEAAARAAQEAADAQRAQAQAERERLAQQDPDDPRNWDPDRAARTIQTQRESERAALQRAEQAEAKAAALEQANETEQQRIERERDEERKQNGTLSTELRDAMTEIAIRDVAAQRDVDPKRMRRLAQLVRADGGVTYDAQGVVQGVEDAVDAVLGDFPEMIGDDGTGSSSPANPARQRKDKEMTRADVEALADSDPDKFNELFDAGKIPSSALGGVR